MEESKPKFISAKVVLVGSSNVGKTSLIGRYVNDEFNPHSPPTINVGYKSKLVKLPDRD